MDIQSFFEGTVVEKASDALVLSLTPTDALPPAEQQKKIDLICARNRMIGALKKCSKNSLQDKIQVVENFYDEIGGEEEQKTARLSLLSSARFIEGSILGSIIASAKPDRECSPKELAEKEKQKKTRNQIIEAAHKKASSPTVVYRLTKFLERLDASQKINS